MHGRAYLMRRARIIACVFAVYTVLVLTIDTLALHGIRWGLDWSYFQWRPFSAPRSASPFRQGLIGFDAFKFTAWLVIPLCACVFTLEPRWFSLARWERRDVMILAALAVLGALAVLSISVFPGLRAMYPSASGLTPEQRIAFASMQGFWMISWLPGWEFIHRYALLRHIKEGWSRAGLLPALFLIPLIEALYHVIQGKGLLESAAVYVFGIVLCAWAWRRENVLLPFAAHASVEVVLVLFLLAV